MARNRRKEREDHGSEGARKRRRVILPEDTNAEMLPTKSQIVQDEVSVQVPPKLYSSGKWLTCEGTYRAEEAYWEEEKKI